MEELDSVDCQNEDEFWNASFSTSSSSSSSVEEDEEDQLSNGDAGEPSVGARTELIIGINVKGGAANVALPTEVEQQLGRLRYLLSRQEYTEEGVMLSRVAVWHNASDYTAWEHRRRCLLALPTSRRTWRDELMFIRRLCRRQHKVYQVWWHRRWVIDNIDRECCDRTHLRRCIDLDPKNIHMWNYRQWLVLRFDVDLQKEFEVTIRLLERDPYNHSAWHYRKFLQSLSNDVTADSLTTHESIDLALKYIQSTPGNESPWLYLFSFFTEPLADISRDSRTSARLPWSSPAAKRADEVVSEIARASPVPRFALEWKYRMDLGKGDLHSANKRLLKLEETADTRRRNYWKWMRRQIAERLHASERSSL